VVVKFLVDTGSNITILSPAVLEKISAPRRSVLEKVENRMILADGSAKLFRGKGTFELEVEGKRALQEVWIADRAGRDFGYGFCVPVWLSDHYSSWRPAGTIHPSVDKCKWNWNKTGRREGA